MGGGNRYGDLKKKKTKQERSSDISLKLTFRPLHPAHSFSVALSVMIGIFLISHHSSCHIQLHLDLGSCMSFSLCLRFFSFFFLVYSFVARCTFNPQFLLPWFLESSPPIIWQPASFANLEDSTHISYPACTSQQIPPFRIISSQEEVREEKCPGYIT